ncbi:histidine kinase [Phycicoccus sp.]|uniref:sensor histidine kinase n=1 Tax=Phycicoccus sp. TaxID=1902410 RepID=UPI002C7504BB|nr:histidine kinase [Phycicoccus sp.]HMM96080.1 histidine kinase [Phycicoccus sp.]
MPLPRLPGWVRGPEPEGSMASRVRAYLVLNLVAIWLAVVLLVGLDRWIGPSTSLRWNLLALVVAGLAYFGALGLGRRGRTRPAAAVAIGSTWLVAFSLVWATPFTTPVSLLVLHVPSLILIDTFRSRARAIVLGTTVALTGIVAATGEWRRTAWVMDHPDLPATPLLVGGFTLLVAAVLVLGIRDSVARVTRGRRELSESRARLAGASFEARRSIERDLHDGAQQRLATLAVDIGRLNRALETDPARARDIAHGLSDQLSLAIRDLRDLAHGIYPPILAERGLAGALPAAARRTALPCVVEVDELTGRHTPEVEAAVYFCCLEAMHNADRHSGGTLIRVVASDRDGLRFSVADDGTGFDVGAQRGAHGLTGMRDRLQSAGGRLDVRSTPGDGTTVEGVFADVEDTD